MNPKINSFLVLSGVFGPVIFALVLLAIGFLSPGYSQLDNYISELGATGAPHAVVMNIFGFMLLGLFIVLFSVGLYRKIGTSLSGKMGSALIAISGIGMASVGVFPCDAGCMNHSFTGMMHGPASAVPLVSAVIAFFFIAYSLRKARMLKGLWRYTLASAILAAIFGFIYININTPLPGLVQRVTVAIPLLWMVVSAVKIYRQHIQ